MLSHCTEALIPGAYFKVAIADECTSSYVKGQTKEGMFKANSIVLVLCLFNG